MPSSLQESRNLWKSLIVPIFYIGLELGFPVGRDSATCWDKGIEVPLLSRDKGTMGQALNLTKGQPVKIWDGTWDGMVKYFDRLSRPVPQDKTGQSRKVQFPCLLPCSK